MIRLVLDSIAAGYEQDIRELVQAFYPGEEFEIRTPEGVHFSNTTQEEKNALKQAQATGEVTAANWDWFADRILGEVERRKQAGIDRPVKVLNLFAYTGGATLAAAAAGAQVTHVDASKGMVQWAKENAEASHLKDAPIRWLVDDCMKFVEREIRRGNTYDAIIMDPPSYGRGPKGEIWKIEDSVYPLVQQAAKLLTEDSIFFLINSYTTGLQPAVMSYMLGTAIRARLGGVIHSEEVGLPVTETGLVLPCGCSGRWESCEKS